MIYNLLLHLWFGMACLPMSGHHLRFRPSRKCSKLIISAALQPRSRACPAPQIRFDWPTQTLSLRPWRVFQIVIIIIIIIYYNIYRISFAEYIASGMAKFAPGMAIRVTLSSSSFLTVPVFLASLLVQLSECYPNGAPDTACSQLTIPLRPTTNWQCTVPSSSLSNELCHFWKFNR